MIEPWAKRALFWAACAAVAHCAAWAGYVHHLQRQSYDTLERRQGVIETIRFSQTGVGGQHTRAKTLVLTLRAADTPHAPPQEVGSGGPREEAAAYFDRHRPGDVVPIWVRRHSGHIVDVLPPAPPDAVRLFLILLPTLGFVTAVAVVGIAGRRA